MNNGIKYDLFYEILLRLREIFHSYGRFDDSNEKLDEINAAANAVLCDILKIDEENN